MMRCISGRRQGLALLAGMAVWAVIFAGAFTCSVYFVQGEAVAYLCLLFLPQVVSSVAGAAVYVAALRGRTSSRCSGRRFAGATCVVSAFAGTLIVFLLDHEMPEGWEFVGFLAVVFVIASVVDGLFAMLGGVLVDSLAGRSTSPGRESQG
jgi:hypothetical protein